MNRNRIRIIQLFLLVIAVAMMVYGGYRGEISTVLNKAINVCLECIGLG